MNPMLPVDTAVVVPVNIAALIDDTDFKSREVAIAYNAGGMDLVWNFLTTAGVMSQTVVTPTTGGVYDWAHLGDGMYTMEIPASGGASINNDTEGWGWFSGIATGVLPWRGPTIAFVPAHVINALMLGTGNGLRADVQHLADDTITEDVISANGVNLIQSGLATAANLATVLGKFTGMTSLADWLRRIVRKDSGSAGMITATTEIATGGTPTYVGTDHNIERVVGGNDGISSTVNSISTNVGKIPKSDGAVGWNATALAQILAQASAALEALLIESGISAGASLTDDAGTQLTSINLRQAISLIASGIAGILAGAAGPTTTTKPAGKPSGNTRITHTVDSTGRTATTLKVPT